MVEDRSKRPQVSSLGRIYMTQGQFGRVCKNNTEYDVVMLGLSPIHCLIWCIKKNLVFTHAYSCINSHCIVLDLLCTSYTPYNTEQGV